MDVRESFTPEEWAGIVAAPMLAGMAVTAAEPGGLVGAAQESFSLAGALRDARITPPKNALIEAVIAAYGGPEGRDIARARLRELASGRKPPAIAEAALAELGRVASAVNTKAPEAAPGFKGWLRQIAERVAGASTEGGFLGFGGERVSAAERSMLGAIAQALA
jgi:hypothetical protein